EEPVPGMDCVRAGLRGRAEVLLGLQVARYLHGLVGATRVQRPAVVWRDDGDRAEPERAARAEHAQRDLAAVRDEYALHLLLAGVEEVERIEGLLDRGVQLRGLRPEPTLEPRALHCADA